MTLHVDQLSVSRSGKRLLTDISFSVTQGEVFAVLGQNGAGKSTLFKALSGEWKPSDGDVVFNGKPMSSWSRLHLAQQRAVLPQQSSLTFDFSVEEVVQLGRSPHATGVELDREIVEHVMELCDVTRFAGRNYTSLSGGEKQRVQLARVLAQIWQENPKEDRLLLLDEPTSALDLAHQHALLTVARNLSRQRVAVLVVLHDLNLASAYADQLMMLHQGKCVAMGSAEEVIKPDLVECVFGIQVKVIDHPESGKPLVVC